MSISTKTRPWILGLAAACLWIAAADAADKTAAKRQETARRMQDFANYLIENQAAPDREIPDGILREAKGIMIYRQFKAGFGIGGHGGGGVVLLRRADGTWSPPAFFQEGGGSIGFQIGGQKVEAIMVIMNDEGVEMLLKTSFTIGVDASAAAGPVGRDAAAKVGPGTAILSYSRAKGLFAGAKIEGGAMVANDEANTALYGPGMRMTDILKGANVPVPPEAAPLMSALERYAPPFTTAPAATSATPVASTPAAPAPGTTPAVPAPVPAPMPTPAPTPLPAPTPEPLPAPTPEPAPSPSLPPPPVPAPTASAY